MKKYSIFSRVFDITNQLLTRHAPFAPLGRVDEWAAKPSRFSIQSHLTEFFPDHGCRNTGKSVSLTDSDIQTLLERKQNQITERKTESYVFSGFGNGILAAENENDNWKIYHSPILAVYRKTSSVGKDQVNNW